MTRRHPLEYDEPTIISDAETIIHEAEQLIKNYKNTMKKHEQEGNPNMANSVKGSII